MTWSRQGRIASSNLLPAKHSAAQHRNISSSCECDERKNLISKSIKMLIWNVSLPLKYCWTELRKFYYSWGEGNSVSTSLILLCLRFCLSSEDSYDPRRANLKFSRMENINVSGLNMNLVGNVSVSSYYEVVDIFPGPNHNYLTDKGLTRWELWKFCSKVIQCQLEHFPFGKLKKIVQFPSCFLHMEGELNDFSLNQDNIKRKIIFLKLLKLY